MELWKKIRNAIDEAGINQKKLAELCDVTPSTVSLWVSKNPEKRTIPTVYVLMKVAKATGVPIREFTDLLDKDTYVGYEDKGYNPDEMPLWEKIRIARKKRKLTQVELAEACSVTRSSIANWESPDHPSKPNLKQVRRIAELTEVSFQWLSGETSQTPESLKDLAAHQDVNAEQDIESELMRRSEERKEEAMKALLDMYSYIKDHGVSDEFCGIIKYVNSGIKRYCK